MKALNEFMKDNYPYYKEGDWQKTIERYATHAKKRVLKEINGIHITEKELDTIVSLNNKVLERLSFTLLCLAKLALERNKKSNGWVINEDSEIFRLARISAGIEKKAFYINDLRELGMIEYAVKNDNLNLQVLYIDGGENQNNVLYVTDFRELGYEYLKYKGENFIRCADCDILVRNNKQQNKRYCSNCATKSRYERIINKTINCIDCGKEVVVDALDNQTNRCEGCYEAYRRKKNREKALRYYHKNNNNK